MNQIWFFFREISIIYPLQSGSGTRTLKSIWWLNRLAAYSSEVDHETNGPHLYLGSRKKDYTCIWPYFFQMFSRLGKTILRGNYFCPQCKKCIHSTHSVFKGTVIKNKQPTVLLIGCIFFFYQCSNFLKSSFQCATFDVLSILNTIFDFCLLVP